METHECLVVGGGIIGASVAYHLSRLGLTDVALLEREPFLGARATAKSAGGVRQQFTTEINIRLSQLSVQRLLALPAELGIEFAFHQHGYLFLAKSAARLAQYRANVAVQQALGVPVALLDHDAIARRWPFLRHDDVAGGTFCGADGFTDPHEFTQGFAQHLRRRGGTIAHGVEVLRLARAGGCWQAHAADRSFEAPRLVLAAGVWTAGLAAGLGIEVPARPYRRQLVLTTPVPAIPDVIPLVVDSGSGFYFRKETGALLMGAINPAEGESFNETVDDDWNATIIERALDRLPALADAGLRRTWAGLYCVTPDHHAILGAVDGFPGLFLATGFSGHGIMHSPAAGQCVAEAVVYGRARVLDIECLNLRRFAQGALLHEQHVI